LKAQSFEHHNSIHLEGEKKTILHFDIFTSVTGNPFVSDTVTFLQHTWSGASVLAWTEETPLTFYQPPKHGPATHG